MDSKVYSSMTLNDLRQHLEKVESKYITYPKFIFLCGKGFDKPDDYYKTNRGILHRYIESLNNEVFIVLSERLWENSYIANIDLLTFEEFLAEISDYIILFAESAGSFCELGAFTYADKLFNEKLIIVLDSKYKTSSSFINNGPVLKAKKDNAMVLYAPIEHGALLSDKNMRQTISEIIIGMNKKISLVNRRFINYDSVRININSFIVEILELLRITEPIAQTDILSLYKAVKGFDVFSFVKSDGTNFHNEITVKYIYRLLEMANLIQIDKTNGYLSMVNHEKTQSFMLKYRGFSLDRVRNQLICRKYKNKELV